MDNKMENKLRRMLLVPVGKEPIPVMVEKDLQALLSALGCEAFGCAYDEVIGEDAETFHYVNDYGKLDGSSPNRAVYGAEGEIVDVIFGDFLIGAVSLTDGDPIDLPETAMRRYEERYRDSSTGLNAMKRVKFVDSEGREIIPHWEE